MGDTIVRKTGYPSRAELETPSIISIDCRSGRPVPPDYFGERERRFWDLEVLSRRPNWFCGAEKILADYVIAQLAAEDLAILLARTKANAGKRYLKLVQAHRQAANCAVMLAVRLRLTPSSKIPKTLEQDGDKPVPGMGYYAGQPTVSNQRDMIDDATGERSFAKLREAMMSPAKPKPQSEPEPEEDDEAAHEPS